MNHHISIYVMTVKIINLDNMKDKLTGYVKSGLRLFARKHAEKKVTYSFENVLYWYV